MSFERAYRRGDSGPAVAEIRAKLARLELLQLRPDPLDPLAGTGTASFDDDTDRAVRTFQQQRGLTVDGVVGATTYQALDEARWRLGDRILSHIPARLLAGDDVSALQQRLLDMGFDCGRVDASRPSKRCVSSSATSASPPTAPAVRPR